MYLTRSYAFHPCHWIYPQKCRFGLRAPVSPLPLDICTAWKCFPLPHPRQVWPYAEQTAFLLWWVYFDTFRLISNSPTSNQMNEIDHLDRHVALDCYRYSAYAGFDCHRLRTILWRNCFYFFVAAWVFKSFMIFSGSKSRGSVNRGFHSQFF